MLLAAVAPARAERIRAGGMVGVRMTDLRGQVASDPWFGFALAGVVERPWGSNLTAATEPGIRWSGSEKYSLLYVALPLLARVRYPLDRDWQVRATVGMTANVLLRAGLLTSGDESVGRSDIRSHLRWWDLAIVAGAGVERGRLFAEVRWSRGLFTIHADDPSLFAVTTELGFWLGVMQ